MLSRLLACLRRACSCTCVCNKQEYMANKMGWGHEQAWRHEARSHENSSARRRSASLPSRLAHETTPLTLLW